MITCPQCGAQNLPGLAYCENCGSPLPQQAPAATGAPAAAAPQSAPTAPTAGPSPAEAAASAPPPPPQPDPVAAAMPQPVMPVDQPPPGPDMGVPAPTASGANVVAAEPADGATADTSTAAPPAGTAAAPAGTPAPTAASPAGATLTLTFPTGQVYTMEEDTVNVGRTDVAQNWHPELDVIPYGGGAPDLGVSRHQARLVRQDGGFVVIDMGSTNGTYVNGRAAPYNQTVPLQDGDTLSFGALNTQVSIK